MLVVLHDHALVVYAVQVQIHIDCINHVRHSNTVSPMAMSGMISVETSTLGSCSMTYCRRVQGGQSHHDSRACEMRNRKMA